MERGKKPSRRAGFTLVELCIVIAITAIVVTMVATFTILSNNQQNEITAEASRIAEVTNAQKAINDWVRSYDQQIYDIRANDDQMGLTVFQGEEPIDTLYFSEGVIFGNGTEKTNQFEDISGISFSVINSDTQQLIRATIVFGEENEHENQFLLFAVYSGMSRDRSVMGRNG